MLDKLIKLINHNKIEELRQTILLNFDEDILKSYETTIRPNKKTFIFLFKL
jgi:hypothetical protein